MFVASQWWVAPGFTLIESLLGPIPDYIQVVFSLFYMYACVTKNYTDQATVMVMTTKYLQAAVLPYMTVMTYLNGPRHNMFLAGFTFMKAFFNFYDASDYMNRQYDITGMILGLL